MTGSRRDNNFDLLRLLAALQVVVLHAAGHLEAPMSESVKAVLRLFPGVPIFFTISGFLIFQSYQRNAGDLRQYVLNRIVRIYPGLVATFLLGLVLILWSAPQLKSRDLLLWSFGQITIFQYWTPDSLRSYGVGTPNGALWTIPVELQFYALLPLIYRWWKKVGVAALVVPFVLSILSYLTLFAMYPATAIAYKLFMVCVLPYLFNFLIGVCLAAYFDRVKSFVVGKGAYWFLGYTAAGLLNLFILHWWIGGYTPTNPLGIVSVIVLGITVISLAYTVPHLSRTLLRHNDISYGIYIYHMPIVNLMVQHGLLRRYSYFWLAILLTTAVAIVSWKWLESPLLRMKTRVRPDAPAAASLEAPW